MEVVLLILLLVVLSRLPKKARHKEDGFLVALRLVTFGLVLVLIAMIVVPAFQSTAA